MKIILAFLFVTSSGISWAQEGKPLNHRIWCFDQKAVVEVLSRDYKETAIFHGESESVHYVLYANEKSGGWTMIGYQDGLGCIMAAGKKHTQFFGPKI